VEEWTLDSPAAEVDDSSGLLVATIWENAPHTCSPGCWMIAQRRTAGRPPERTAGHWPAAA